MSHNFNPVAKSFAPDRHFGTEQQSGICKQVRDAPFPYLEARLFNLEEEHANLRDEVDNLRELYHGLSFFDNNVKKGGGPVHVSPLERVDAARSHQSAIQFKLELEQLSHQVQESYQGGTDMRKATGTETSTINDSLPPHINAPSIASDGTNSKSLPPHLRGAKKNAFSNKNGYVDYESVWYQRTFQLSVLTNFQGSRTLRGRFLEQSTCYRRSS